MRLMDEIAANTSGGPLFKCKACGATGDPYDGFCRTCGYLLSKDEMLKRADALIERDIQSRTPYPIRGLAYIRGVGRIDLEVGKKGSPLGYDYGTGLSKLLKKHKEEIKNLALTLVLGKTAKSDEEDRLIRVHGDRFAAIGKRPFGGSIITHYKDAKKAASFESRPVNAGAVGRLSLPTLHPNLALADGIGVAASDGYYRIFPSLKSRGFNSMKNCIMLSSRNAVVNRALAWKAGNAAVAHNLTVGALPPEEFEKGRDVYLQAECGIAFDGWAINKTYPHGTFVKSGFKTADAAAAWAKQNGYVVRFVAEILIKRDIPKVRDYEAACRKYGVKRV